MIAFQHQVDARKQPCPMPILLLKRQLKNTASGEVIFLTATDPNSRQDLTHFCQVQGLIIRHTCQQDDEFHYYIEKP